jgi:hypothetical protein
LRLLDDGASSAWPEERHIFELNGDGKIVALEFR